MGLEARQQGKAVGVKGLPGIIKPCTKIFNLPFCPRTKMPKTSPEEF